MVKRERRNAVSMHGVVKEFSGFVAGGGTGRNMRDSINKTGSDPFNFFSLKKRLLYMKKKRERCNTTFIQLA